jgi:hypothetical protein
MAKAEDSPRCFRLVSPRPSGGRRSWKWSARWRGLLNKLSAGLRLPGDMRIASLRAWPSINDLVLQEMLTR